jgi:hypothetical protein
MKMIVPGSILYVSSLWSIKFALVLFYKKLAAPGSKMQIAYNFALAGLAVTYTTIFFDILFQCYPYDKRWSKDPTYQCSPKASRVNYWITILFNIFSDFIIICLPITMVMKLQMKLKQRLAVAFIFALGGFVLIASSRFNPPMKAQILQVLTIKSCPSRLLLAKRNNADLHCIHGGKRRRHHRCLFARSTCHLPGPTFNQRQQQLRKALRTLLEPTQKSCKSQHHKLHSLDDQRRQKPFGRLG